MSLAGVKSTKAQDMVDTLKAREEKLIVHFRDGHEKEESVPTIKFGKDGNDNTIEISLSSQNSLDHLKLRVIVSFSIYLYFIFDVSRMQKNSFLLLFLRRLFLHLLLLLPNRANCGCTCEFLLLFT